MNGRLWSGWAVAGRERRLFFAGDTGYWQPYFEAIGARLGPFDVAAVSIGAYTPAAIMRFTHTTPEEALQIFADVRARRFVAMHWGTFDLADEPLTEPPERLRAEAAPSRSRCRARVDPAARRDPPLVAAASALTPSRSSPLDSASRGR